MRNIRGTLLLLGLSFLLQSVVTAQIHDRLHWVFPVDSVDQVDFDLVDPFVVDNWDGNQIMVTSEITVYNATKGIMKFFIEENKRWEIIDTLQNGILTIDSYQSRRAPIQSGGEECYEIVKVKVFLPSDYMRKADSESWIRKKEEEESQE
ncbi:hypothetical protein [Lewinella cohaerens]|uniref:hypothetical protein n=1 Tax=Lewinella cohaerens TaxID=70995 RepID=UPI00035FC43E|nr:hypothetical protein [Lewinella cohaerens]